MRGVVVAPEPLAVEVGARILEKGGSAFDAGIAAAVAEGVTNPFLNGIGGTGAFFCKAANEEPKMIDCNCSIGSRERPRAWVDRFRGRSEAWGRYIIEGDDQPRGYQGIMTPGFVKGIWTVFHRFASGRFSWPELLEPSIRLCIDGFTVYPDIARRWSGGTSMPGYFGFDDKLRIYPELRRCYLKDGKAYRTGDVLVQPDYGHTLERMAKDGGDVFYKGDIGDVIARDLEAHGSLVTREDLYDYVAFEDDCVWGEYKGYDIAAASGGYNGIQVIQMLNIVRHFDLKSLGHNTPAYVDLMAKVMRAGFSDNTPLKGDAPYTVQRVLQGRALSKQRAEWWADRIKSGDEAGQRKGPSGLGSNTTHLTIIDGEGNVVAWTHSLGTLAGSGAITPGLGFLYNDFLGHFNPMPNNWDSMVPGKRFQAGAQMILLRDGRPFLVLGAPGGSRLITAVFQVIVDVVDFGMSIEEAVKLPRFHSEQERVLYVEPSISEDVCGYMRGKGFRVDDSEERLSRVQAASVDPATGTMHGGVDQRGGSAIVVE